VKENGRVLRMKNVKCRRMKYCISTRGKSKGYKGAWGVILRPRKGKKEIFRRSRAIWFFRPIYQSLFLSVSGQKVSAKTYTIQSPPPHTQLYLNIKHTTCSI
jgi:hypothetical protein